LRAVFNVPKSHRQLYNYYRMFETPEELFKAFRERSLLAMITKNAGLHALSQKLFPKN